MSSSGKPSWATKDAAKSALAVVGAAALSVSLFHSLKVLWRTYEQRVTNKRLEEYPTPAPSTNGPLAFDVIHARLPTMPHLCPLRPRAVIKTIIDGLSLTAAVCPFCCRLVLLSCGLPCVLFGSPGVCVCVPALSLVPPAYCLPPTRPSSSPLARSWSRLAT